MNHFQKAALISLITVVLLTTGCNLSAPRARMGCLATATPGTRFLDPNSLGTHSYGYNPFEVNGIVYTCKAGHIDITHLRWNADYTRYLAKRIKQTLLKGKDGFKFNLALEISIHKIKFEYPDNWDSLSDQEKEGIADDVANKIGPYLAFNATLWHEILTWHDVHFAGIEPEFNSAFSWEDMYSNLLGTELAAQVISDPNNNHNNRSYDRALSAAIRDRLDELEVLSGDVAYEASKSMKGKWFTGTFNVATLRKNMDAGFDDGFVTPILVPGICPGAEPVPLAVPTTDVLDQYGLTMTYRVYPQEFERGKILKVIHPNGGCPYIDVEQDFPAYLDWIKTTAKEKYNYIVD